MKSSVSGGYGEVRGSSCAEEQGRGSHTRFPRFLSQSHRAFKGGQVGTWSALCSEKSLLLCEQIVWKWPGN